MYRLEEQMDKFSILKNENSNVELSHRTYQQISKYKHFKIKNITEDQHLVILKR